jgi:hypothetical protein
MTQLNEHQVFERDWWGNCVNTFGEEAKQLTYAQLMGLTNVPDPTTSHWPQYDLVGLNVLDLGGGPASMLLKTVDPGRLTVVDPCPYPPWVAARYTEAGIEYFQEPAETFVSTPTRGRNNVELYDYDEVWIYNVLQHVEDPAACIATARRHAPTLRIFDWVNTPPSLGHPHTLTKASLDEWIGAPPGAHSDAIADGTVRHVAENGAIGFAYCGVFSLTPPDFEELP